MKYLSNYVEDAQTELFKETGAFFAFSNEQFSEGVKKVGANKENKVMSFGMGGYVLSKNIDLLINGLNNINKKGIELDIKENGIKNIIWRELANYETQITGDILNTVEALADYGITSAEIRKVYKNDYFPHCVENDLF